MESRGRKRKKERESFGGKWEKLLQSSFEKNKRYSDGEIGNTQGQHNYCALVTTMKYGRLDFLKHYRIKNNAFLVNLLLKYTDPHVRAIRDVLSIYGDDLTSDEDGYDEIQTSLNDCECGFLGGFSNENLYISFFVSVHTFLKF